MPISQGCWEEDTRKTLSRGPGSEQALSKCSWGRESLPLEVPTKEADPPTVCSFARHTSLLLVVSLDPILQCPSFGENAEHINYGQNVCVPPYSYTEILIPM